MGSPWGDDHPEAQAEVPPPEGMEEVRSWQPLDLGPVLDGTWEPPRPTVGLRGDKAGMFYPGRLHTVASESEAGKTWLALCVAVEAVVAGSHVVYVDFEDDEGGTVGRLLAMQLGHDAIRDRFHYLRPETPLGTGLHRDDLLIALATHRPVLVVVDGVTEAMSLHGLNPLDNDDVARFGRIVTRVLAVTGAAVVCLDHVTKAAEGRGRYALGAVHKLNGVNGAAYVLENRATFGIGRVGRSTIRVAKDRPGQVRKNTVPSAGGMDWFGDLVVDGHDEAWVEVEVRTPNARDDTFRPTVLMERVAKALEQHGPMSKNLIENTVHGKATSLRQAVAYLILDGYVTEKTPHELIRPYPSEASDT